MTIERHKEIKRRRHRRDKVKKIRARLEKISDTRERARLIRKIKATAPYAEAPSE